ncbi:MAG: S41 family peptidase [Kiritimatiellae bacterium]|nr:S41 family peptidase [Kiritimatiellia bacterium]MDW8458928.1 S41 family peptidase [Verrucomicrobiota bacterium]
MKRFGIRAGWAIAVGVLAANWWLGARLYSQEPVPERDDPYQHIAIFTRAIEQIRENYVDTNRVAYKDLVQGALRGMLQSLDPHSQFLDAEMFKEMKDDTSGQFGGLGIVVGIKDGALTIIAPMEDTPGFRAGLLAGDRIVEIDGVSTDGMSLPDAVKKLRGAPGTRVTLRIMRQPANEFLTKEIERANIEVVTVKDARILQDGIGYVRITQFNEPTAEALKKELDRLRGEGLQALVIDLRNNPGGLLSSAIDVAQLFLDRNQVIVSTQGRNPSQNKVYRARQRARYEGFPIAILVNGGSASASEIVAGALQDNRRAVLVGEKTFGKGSVQSVLPMDDGTALRLTTARYITPAERIIQDRGIEPDIVVPMSPEDLRNLLQRRAEPNADPLRAAEDPQLQRAMDVLRGVMKFTRARPAGEYAAAAAP